MKVRQMVSVALKLIGIFVLMEMLRVLPNYVGLFMAVRTGGLAKTATWAMQVLSAVALLAPVVIAYALIIKSDVVGQWLIPESDDVELGNGLDAEPLLAVALAAIGVYALVKAIPLLVGQIVADRQIRFAGGPMRPSISRGLITSGVQIAIGVGLFFQARGLAGVWRKLRGPGAPE